MRKFKHDEIEQIKAIAREVVDSVKTKEIKKQEKKSIKKETLFAD